MRRHHDEQIWLCRSYDCLSWIAGHDQAVAAALAASDESLPLQPARHVLQVVLRLQPLLLAADDAQ